MPTNCKEIIVKESDFKHQFDSSGLMYFNLAFIVSMSVSEAEGRVHSLAFYRVHPPLQLNIDKLKHFLQRPVASLSIALSVL